MARKARPIKRKTEDESNQLAHDKQGETVMKDLHELTFRYELEILLSEYQAKRAVKAIDISNGAIARYWGEFVTQDTDYIAKEIQSRLLANHDKNPSLYQIKTYLKVVNRVIASKLANNESISAIPFVGLLNHLPKRRGQHGKTKAKKERKQGRKRPVLGYESMKAASEATGESYDYLRRLAEKNMI